MGDPLDKIYMQRTSCLNRPFVAVVTSIVVLAILVLALVPAQWAQPTEEATKVESKFVSRAGSEYLAKPPKPGKPNRNKAEVTILTPIDGDSLFGVDGFLTVVAEVKGLDSPAVECRFGGDGVAMDPRPGNRYMAEVAFPDAGFRTITITATDGSDPSKTASSTIEVEVVSNYEYALSIEMDYYADYVGQVEAMSTYLVDYYRDRAVDVTVVVDDAVSDGDGPWVISDGVTDDEFWAIEAANNDGGGDYTSPSKWVFVGTTDQDNPNVMGYIWVLKVSKNVYAGNYIYIAKEGIDNHLPGMELGGEVCVLMHEFGHSIGILVTRGRFEAYDPDSYSVMSYLSTNNAGMADAWYYSPKYWGTRDLQFYPATP